MAPPADRQRGAQWHGAARLAQHQRLNQGAVVLPRNLRSQADLWAAVATRSFRFRCGSRCLGPFARSTRDWRAIVRLMQGVPTCRLRRSGWPALPELAPGLDGLRIAVASGYFQDGAFWALAALDRVAKAVGAHNGSKFPGGACHSRHHHRRRGCISTAANRSVRSGTRPCSPRYDPHVGGEGAKIPPLVPARV